MAEIPANKRRRGPYRASECASEDNFEQFELKNSQRPSQTQIGTWPVSRPAASAADLLDDSLRPAISAEGSRPTTSSSSASNDRENMSKFEADECEDVSVQDCVELSQASLTDFLEDSLFTGNTGGNNLQESEEEHPEQGDVYYVVDDNEDECEWFDAVEFLSEDESYEEVTSFVKSTGCDDDDDDDDDFIYEGSSMKVGAFMLLLAVYISTNNLTGAAVSQLLTFLSLALPQGAKICSSLSALRKYIKDIQSPVKIHYFCPVCLTSVEKNSENCPNSECAKDLTADKPSFFVEIPLAYQICSLFKRPGFSRDIKHRFTRKKKTDSAIEDIYDGNLYKLLSGDGGVLNSEQNLSLLFNTDGVPVFKSSKVSMWPVYFVVNELPFSKRTLKENLLFGGLWFGEMKPPMWHFLRPFYESLKDLEQSGIEVSVAGNLVRCKVILLGATFDLPARSMVVNSVQYNGAFGCWKCLQPGKTVKISQRGHVHAFPFQENYKGPPRTKKNALEDAFQMAQNPRQCTSIRGIKGPCWLSLLSHFDHVRGVGIDYMHGVLLGVQKRLLSLWFESQYKKEPFSLHSYLPVVEKRLLQIRPTLDISRLPRSISEHLKYWKANEYRSFLLYYSLPLLYNIMKEEYFNHYCLFVSAIAILLKSSILPEELTKAEHHLKAFCERFSALYKERYYGLNVHQLLHLCDCVRDLGPLFTHSCFYFESANGFLLKLIRGTQHIDKQIVNAVCYLQRFPEMYSKFIEPCSNEDDLYIQMQLPPKPIRTKKLKNKVFMLGSSYVNVLSGEVFEALVKFLNFRPQSKRVNCFNRIELNNLLIYGTNYKRMVSRCNSVVKAVKENATFFALIDFFLLWEEDVLAVAKQLHCTHYNEANHITAVKERESLFVFDVENISDLCIYIKFGDLDTSYICEFPNRIERD